MSTKKIHEVIDRYEHDLSLMGEALDEDLIHLQEMFPKMRVFLAQDRREKLMRWLGFVQGVLWAKQVYTLEELKSHNMPTEEV